MITRQCKLETCPNTFTLNPQGGNKKFCSKICSNKYHIHKPYKVRFCIVCHTELTGTAYKKFCKDHFTGWDKPEPFCVVCNVSLKGIHALKFCKEHKPTNPKHRYCSDCGAPLVDKKHRCPYCWDKHNEERESDYSAQIKSHQNHPESHSRTVRNVHLKHRIAAINKLGGKCELEDSTCSSKFNFHHRNWDGGSDPVRKQGSEAMAVDILRRKKPKKKYALLCTRHHGEVHSKHKLELKAKDNEAKVQDDKTVSAVA